MAFFLEDGGLFLQVGGEFLPQAKEFMYLMGVVHWENRAERGLV